MIIYIGADHRGFYLKEAIKAELRKEGYEVFDLGNAESDQNDDYPDFAQAVGEKVAGTHGEVRGILICGSGIGVDVAANKIPGVRSALAFSPDHIRTGRHDDNVNVLSLAADFTKPEDALAMVHVFLATPFEPEIRYLRRLEKIKKIEEEEKN